MEHILNRLAGVLEDAHLAILSPVFSQLSLLDNLNISQSYRILGGLNSNRAKADLYELGYLRLDRDGRFRVRARYLPLFTEHDNGSRHIEIRPTFQGREELLRLKAEKKLTTKATYPKDIP